ncbi:MULTISPECIES: hypothetical protein [unclassified Lentimicrobium]|uniref:hypothetical protein n=1 Tax=unclassified Lentimicrobium TaxID=2677434 RepID=UPI00155584A6|nr:MULTISPECIES: hypothetical protein [unclassified Lentimicrobium]NPD44745.1 hypothetical protein [Lentimicrobium sp. S6]NPD83399.1 hypothetical protein [Lentimicrobium sp. L6]
MSNSLFCSLKYQESKYSKNKNKGIKPFAEEISGEENADNVFKKPDIIQSHKNTASKFKRFKIWIKSLKHGA